MYSRACVLCPLRRILPSLRFVGSLIGLHCVQAAESNKKAKAVFSRMFKPSSKAPAAPTNGSDAPAADKCAPLATSPLTVHDGGT